MSGATLEGGAVRDVPAMLQPVTHVTGGGEVVRERGLLERGRLQYRGYDRVKSTKVQGR